jgi:hypothetical protein
MVVAVIALQIAVVYMPALQLIFKTIPMTFEAMAWSLVPGVVVFVVLELEKKISTCWISSKKVGLINS